MARALTMIVMRISENVSVQVSALLCRESTNGPPDALISKLFVIRTRPFNPH